MSLPTVSILLPTYNRADTILRAVRSVQGQTWQDWELLIIDDGSSDQTAEVLQPLDDPRIVYLQQANQGVTAARNRGLTHARGQLIAFLDSDDEWLPYHLELCVNFLSAHPAEQLVSCELIEDFGNHQYLHHYEAELFEWYPQLARQLGSTAFMLPPGETDQHLSVYQTRQAFGEWGQRFISHPQAKALATKPPWHYRGDIYAAWRWGFLLWLPTTVIRRAVVQTLGPFGKEYPICSDFAWLADCSRRFTINYLSLPTALKHELAPNGKPLSTGHLAKDKTLAHAAQELLRYFENNYWQLDPANQELCRLRSNKQLYLAQSLLMRGARLAAREQLNACWAHSVQKPQVFWLLLLSWLVPHDRACQTLYNFGFRAAYTWQLVRDRKITLRHLFGKVLKRL